MLKTIAFGTTVLDQGLKSGGIDGIGHYCQALLKEFSLDPENYLFQPFSFGINNSPSVAFSLPDYPNYLLKSSLKWPYHGNQFFENVDIVHSTDQLFPLTTSKPVIATVMDAIPISHPEWLKPYSRFLKPLLWKRFVKNADHIITISDFSKQQIIEHLKVPENKITSIPLGVHSLFFERIPLEDINNTLLRCKIRRPFFLSIGSIQPRKNLVRLIKAHQALPNNLAKEFPLVIIGKHAWQDKEMLEILHAAVRDSRCVWLQYVNEFDKRCLLQAAIALTFVSLYEGFGLPVLEGYASQTPVITSNSSALIEVANNSAILVEATSIDSIRNGLLNVTNQSINHHELIQQGLETAKNFTWTKTAKETLCIYKLFY